MTGIHLGLDPGGWVGDELVPLVMGLATVSGWGGSTGVSTCRIVTGPDFAAHLASSRRNLVVRRLIRRGVFSMPMDQVCTPIPGRALAPTVTSDRSGQGSAGIEGSKYSGKGFTAARVSFITC